MERAPDRFGKEPVEDPLKSRLVAIAVRLRLERKNFRGYWYRLRRRRISEKLRRRHIRRHQVLIAVIVRQRIHVLFFADVVDREITPLAPRGIAGHAAGEIAAKQAVDIVFDEEFARREFAGPGKELTVELLLPAHEPGPERIFDEFERLLFDVSESRPLEIADQMRRYSENPADFIDLEFAALDELGVIGLECLRLEFHAFFEDGDFMPRARRAMRCAPSIR